MDNEKNLKEYDIISREQIYKGRIFDIVKDRIVLPNGKEADRELVMHNGAAAIIPLDNEGNILFVKQHRHAAGEFVFEIPAGKLEKDENPFDCASRELEEETGYKSNDIKLLTSFYTAIGFANEVIHVYLAENLIESRQNLDEDEFVTVERISLADAKKMVYDNSIKDSKTIVAIMMLCDIKGV